MQIKEITSVAKFSNFTFLIPQMKKSEIVNLFKKEGCCRKNIYNTINRVQRGGTSNDKKETGRPTSWIPNVFRGNHFR